MVELDWPLLVLLPAAVLLLVVVIRGLLAKLAVANLLCESARSSSCATHMVTLKVCEDGFQEADSLYFDCGDASRVEAFTLMLADGIRSS